MKTSDLDILFVPGLEGAGPDHWQARWAAKLSTARLLAPAPDRDQIVRAVLDAAAACSRPVVLVGHAMGARAIAHAARDLPAGLVKGAMLVVPPDRSEPREKLPFKSMLVASRNDPAAPYDALLAMAEDFGATFLDAGEAGGIDAASGHGPWPEGLMSFAGFLRGL